MVDRLYDYIYDLDHIFPVPVDDGQLQLLP